MDVNRDVFAVRLRRAQLLELMEGRESVLKLDAHDVRVDPASGEVVAVWQQRFGASSWSIPGALIVLESDLEDFLAWSVTYMRRVGPLTAQLRILSPGMFRALTKHPQGNLRDLIAGAAGIVLSEGMVFSGGDGAGGGSASSASAATLSFALLRAAQLGFDEDLFREITNVFQFIRRDVQRPFHSAAVESIVRVVEGLLGVKNGSQKSGEDKSGREWLRRLHQGSDVYEAARHVLGRSGDLLASKEIDDLRSMTAEERVLLLDRLGPSLIHGPGSMSDRAFALALATFVCRPGFDQQISLLSEHARSLPEARLWLGALQIAAPVDEALSAGNGSGWWVARELLRDDNFLSPPQADVSATELALMLRSKSSHRTQLMRRSQITVELAPMVYTVLPLRDSSEDYYAAKRTLELDETIASARQAVETASRALEIASVVLRNARGGREDAYSETRSKRRS